jgi:hypothetical protein
VHTERRANIECASKDFRRISRFAGALYQALDEQKRGGVKTRPSLDCGISTSRVRLVAWRLGRLSGRTATWFCRRAAWFVAGGEGARRRCGAMRLSVLSPVIGTSSCAWGPGYARPRGETHTYTIRAGSNNCHMKPQYWSGEPVCRVDWRVWSYIAWSFHPRLLTATCGTKRTLRILLWRSSQCGGEWGSCCTKLVIAPGRISALSRVYGGSLSASTSAASPSAWKLRLRIHHYAGLASRLRYIGAWPPSCFGLFSPFQKFYVAYIAFTLGRPLLPPSALLMRADAGMS